MQLNFFYLAVLPMYVLNIICCQVKGSCKGPYVFETGASERGKIMRIKTARELYCELLKEFYFGIYQKGDQLMTYQEANETYGLAKDTIGKAYGMLRRDGFIRSDSVEGTIVIFDKNNPEHVAKVPLIQPRQGEKTAARYEITIRLHANALFTGLNHSDSRQLLQYKHLTDSILQCIRNSRSERGNRTWHHQVIKLWMGIISALDNKIINRITEHYVCQYFYLLPEHMLPPERWSRIHNSSIIFYEYLKEALEKQDFSAFSAQFWKHYNCCYKQGGVVFSKLENGAIFKEQALYGKLMDELCIKIIAGDFKKGDQLPTTTQLCAEYNLSTSTVNRTYSILAEMGIISRRVRSGTRLIVDPGDIKAWEKIENTAGFRSSELMDAVETILMVNKILNKCISISPKVLKQMQAELMRQQDLFERYSTPFLVSAILISPAIAALPTGILHRYYFELIDILNRVVALCTFRFHESQEYGREIYQLAHCALCHLERGEQSLFAIESEHAISKNMDMLIEHLRCSRI